MLGLITQQGRRNVFGMGGGGGGGGRGQKKFGNHTYV